MITLGLRWDVITVPSDAIVLVEIMVYHRPRFFFSAHGRITRRVNDLDYANEMASTVADAVD